ncbi:GNAT family N-acetyltransferase [Streptomyces sp. NPDC052023]|uniref:GNAT family N-acetyltransferase n=1 Tax=Streptomyces sp. NPDC052023 TaxID=3365681 RepID=UPI0037D660FB
MRSQRRHRPPPGDGGRSALRPLGPEASWITDTWGGPPGLACTHFRGARYGAVAVYTVPENRRHRLTLACITALCGDITAGGHLPSWNCSLHNRPGRLLAWNAGFRLVREYVHYADGSPSRQEPLAYRQEDEARSAREPRESVEQRRIRPDAANGHQPEGGHARRYFRVRPRSSVPLFAEFRRPPHPHGARYTLPAHQRIGQGGRYARANSARIRPEPFVQL